MHSNAAIERGLVAPVYGWGSMAVFGKDTFGYLTQRPDTPASDPAGLRVELGVCAYGPGGAELANRIAGRIRAWGAERRSIASLWIEVHPAGASDPPGGQMVVEKRHTRVVVRTAQVCAVVNRG